MRRDPDPRDWRANRGPDQPGSMQGSTRMGDCTVCKAASQPVERITQEVASGPGPRGRFVCLPCYRRLAAEMATSQPSAKGGGDDACASG
jgi:hypothetical protein